MEKKIPKVFIIVLNFNGRDTIRACLESVYKSDYPNYEIIVADNASKDGSFETAKKYFSKAYFILSSTNIGFAAGNNTAIRLALEKFADYIFLLNNDATVEKDSISKLVEEAEKNAKAGIVSPVIYRPDGTIWYSGGKINWLKMRALHSINIEKQIPYETKFASGCAMLVKKNVFREVGLLSENYFLYYEDADLSLKSSNKGFRIMVVPDAHVTHWEKSEEKPEEKIYWLVLSGIIFFKKNTPAILKLWINAYFFMRQIKNWMDVKFKGDNISLAVQRAYNDFRKNQA